MEGFMRMSSNMLASMGEMGSWLQVYNKKEQKNKGDLGSDDTSLSAAESSSASSSIR